MPKKSTRCARYVTATHIVHTLFIQSFLFGWPIFGRPFVALCHRTVVCMSCPVLSVTLEYCGQTGGGIKMKVGTQVGLGPDHSALDGDPGPISQRGTIFGPYLLWPNGSMDQGTT